MVYNYFDHKDKRINGPFFYLEKEKRRKKNAETRERDIISEDDHKNMILQS